MLNHDNGVSGIADFLEQGNELRNLPEVQPGSRLIQQIESAAGIRFSKFNCDFYPLSLASREGLRGLAEADISQSHSLERLQFPQNGRVIGEDGMA